MMIFWKAQPRNQEKFKHPSFGQEFLRQWTEKNGFKMRMERRLEL
jgi:hypothetical protein